MKPCHQTTVTTLQMLPQLILAERRRRHLTVRAAAAEAGVSFATLNRCERGLYTTDRGISVGCAIKILRWLDRGDS